MTTNHIHASWTEREIAAYEEAFARYLVEQEEWANTVNTLHFEGHTLYLPEEPLPPAPPRGYWLRPTRYIELPDGRRAVRIDQERALPLCGVRTPIYRAHIPSSRGTHQCPRCFGWHLTLQPASSSEPAPVTDRITCPHCHADEASLRLDGDELLCMTCSRRFLRPVPEWKEEDVEQNDMALSQAVIFGDTDTEESGTDLPELDVVSADDQQEGHKEEEDGAEDKPWEPNSLTSTFFTFWRSHSLMRQALLAATLEKRLLEECLPLVWTAAACLNVRTPVLTVKEAQEVVEYLCEADGDILISLLTLDNEEELSDVPEVGGLIAKFRDGIRQRAARFRYPHAAVRILAGNYHLPEAAIQAALV